MNHMFDVTIATMYGVPEAVMIQHLYFWIAKNQANGRHFHDGRFWTYSSLNGLAKILPYFSKDQIRRLLKSLQDKGVLYTGNYNKNPCDRTVWYALDNKVLRVIEGVDGLDREGLEEAEETEETPQKEGPEVWRNRHFHVAKSQNACGEIATCYKEQIKEQIKERGGDAPQPPEGEKRSRFVPPTVEEVAAYCGERNNRIDPQTFVDFYASKGWVVGKSKMKDWKAAVRTWEKRDGNSQPERTVNFLP